VGQSLFEAKILFDASQGVGADGVYLAEHGAVRIIAAHDDHIVNAPVVPVLLALAGVWVEVFVEGHGYDQLGGGSCGENGVAVVGEGFAGFEVLGVDADGAREFFGAVDDFLARNGIIGFEGSDEILQGFGGSGGREEHEADQDTNGFF
jgi:hypothetical protein